MHPPIQQCKICKKKLLPTFIYRELTVYTFIKASLLTSIAVLCYSCSPETTGVEDPKTVDELIAQAGEIPEYAGYEKTEIGSLTETITEDDTKYVSNSKKMRLRNQYREIVALSASPDALYPGAVIQGKTVGNGTLTPIIAPITPVTITVGSFSKEIANPSLAAVSAAIQELANQAKPKAANLDYNLSSMYSSEASFLELGLDLNWLIASVRGKYEKSKSVRRSSTLLYMKQVYFTASVSTPPQFTESVTVDQLTGVIGSKNPPCYISSVDYGRIFLVKVTADTTQEALDAALQASYAAYSGSAGFGKLNLNVNTTFEAIILGGSAQGAANAVTRASMDEINQLIRSEATYSPNNPGVPIAYTVRHMRSHKSVVPGKTIDYTIPSWQLDPSSIQKFTVEFKRIEVTNDCDFGTAGDGDIYYSFHVEDLSGNIIAGPTSIPWNRTIGQGDGTTLAVNATHEIIVPKKAGSGFKLIGYVRDIDGISDSTNYEEMGSFNYSFTYPWSDNNYGSEKGIKLEKSPACNGYLVIQLTKH